MAGAAVHSELCVRVRANLFVHVAASARKALPKCAPKNGPLPDILPLCVHADQWGAHEKWPRNRKQNELRGLCRPKQQ